MSATNSTAADLNAALSPISLALGIEGRLLTAADLAELPSGPVDYETTGDG